MNESAPKNRKRRALWLAVIVIVSGFFVGLWLKSQPSRFDSMVKFAYLPPAGGIDMRRQLSITNKTTELLSIDVDTYLTGPGESVRLNHQRVDLAAHASTILLLTAFEIPENQTCQIIASITKDGHQLIRAWLIYFEAWWYCYRLKIPGPRIPKFSNPRYIERIGDWTLTIQQDHGDGSFNPPSPPRSGNN